MKTSTLVITAVILLAASRAASAQPQTVTNGSFEDPPASGFCASADGPILWAPSCGVVPGWTGLFQISDDSNVFGVALPFPDGHQFLALQALGEGNPYMPLGAALTSYASQSVTFTASGSRVFTWSDTVRWYPIDTSTFTYSVLLDSAVVATFDANTQWTPRRLVIAATGGVHTLTFQIQGALPGQDVTIGIDNVGPRDESAAPRSPQTRYSLRDLGELGGGPPSTAGSQARKVNSRGQVVGIATTAVEGEAHAFLWHDGTTRDLGTLGGAYSEALDVNDQGQVVGVSSKMDGSYAGFLWEHDRMTELPIGVVALNNLGQIAGGQTDGDGNYSAVVWDQAHVTTLVNPPRAWFCSPIDISDSGRVLGWCLDADDFSVFYVVWTLNTGAATRLTSDAGSFNAVALNDSGVVIGWWTDGPQSGSAFEWKAGAFTPLSGQSYGVTDINSRGDVTGLVPGATGWEMPVVWSGGVKVNLELPAGAASGMALALADNGIILGSVVLWDPELNTSVLRTVLWTPRPPQ